MPGCWTKMRWCSRASSQRTKVIPLCYFRTSDERAIIQEYCTLFWFRTLIKKNTTARCMILITIHHSAPWARRTFTSPVNYYQISFLSWTRVPRTEIDSRSPALVVSFWHLKFGKGFFSLGTGFRLDQSWAKKRMNDVYREHHCDDENNVPKGPVDDRWLKLGVVLFILLSVCIGEFGNNMEWTFDRLIGWIVDKTQNVGCDRRIR